MPGRTRPVSRSSMRMRKRPPAERANSQASSAVRRLPRCRSPVGLGAKRPVIVPSVPKKLREYEQKRDFEATPEPAGGVGETAELPRFVIQEHSATRLHWDLRLEHDGVLLSWAIPNGIPMTPDENRKAVHTEDHPLEYLDFHGEIPKGSYGAGTMTIWDRGTYVPEKIEDRKVMAEFHGDRVHGRYALFQTGPDPKDWMIHRIDPPEDLDREPMPERIVPMLATAGELPENEAEYGFEIKWDGMRAVVYSQPGRM